MIPPNGIKSEQEESMDTLPDLIAEKLQVWRVFTLEREKREALLYAQFKGEDPNRSATEIKALVQANEDRYQACLQEIKAEADYQRAYEKLMVLKKEMSQRTSF